MALATSKRVFTREASITGGAAKKAMSYQLPPRKKAIEVRPARSASYHVSGQAPSPSPAGACPLSSSVAIVYADSAWSPPIYPAHDDPACQDAA